MCGIAGLWRKDQQRAGAAALEPALTRMRHRGPDDEGFLVADTNSRSVTHLGGDDSPADLPLPSWRQQPAVSGDLILGHRRLSIIDLSPRGHQPMALEGANCSVVFNGEIYNYIELREELRGLGHAFHSGSDTEVILHAWQAWGPDCLNRFNGDWAFALLDLRDGREPELFVARDRYGIKPLFYADTPQAFWFASEAKAFVGTAVPFQPREHAVLRFLMSGELPAGHGSDTFFEGIQQVPPGSAMRITAKGIEHLRWYDLTKAAQPVTSPDEATARKEMEEQVTSAVRLRLRADVPVGSCLSGGVDSSSIVGTMRQLLDEGGKGDLHTFSAVYREKGAFNESAWIEQVVEHARSKSHYTYPDDLPVEEMFDRMVWHQDEPFQTASIYAQWCVMRETRANGVVVLLDGQAADELLGGYQPGTYQEQFLEWLGTGRWWKFIREWIGRKLSTRLSWSTVIRELSQILVLGATGAVKVSREEVDLHDLARTAALRKEMCDILYPVSQRDETMLRAKLAEDQEKLAKWTAKLQKKPDEELRQRIVKKKANITSTQFKLARLRPDSLSSRWASFCDSVRVGWKRLRGTPRHELREYLLRQTTISSLAHLLRFEDRNSMAFSVEARVPFTDYRLVEWAFTRGNAYKIYRGWTKWVLREAMKGRVKDTILWRRDKIGFETPDLTLARKLLARPGFDLSTDAYLAKYLDIDLVKAKCERVKSGQASREESRNVWRWLVLASWHAQFAKLAQP